MDNAKQLLQIIYIERFGDKANELPNLEILGQELASLVGRDEAWGKRYLYSILNYDNFAVSKKLYSALQTFAAIYFDGANPSIGKLHKVIVYSKNGNVLAGSIILGDSKRCPACHALFVGVVHNQRYCSRDCKKKYRRLRNGNS